MQNSPQDVHKKVLGKKGEKLVEEYLKKQGCKILHRNFRTPFGEADIIAGVVNIVSVIIFSQKNKKSSPAPKTHGTENSAIPPKLQARCTYHSKDP